MKKTKITKWAALALAASVTLSLAACGGNGGSAPEGKAAYNCVLNLLANLDAKTGDLNRIRRFV